MTMPDRKKNKTNDNASKSELDEGLEDTFPASDPASENAPGSNQKVKKIDPVREGKRADDHNGELDEGLEDTFPASDPVSATSTTHTGRPDKR